MQCLVSMCAQSLSLFVEPHAVCWFSGSMLQGDCQRSVDTYKGSDCEYFFHGHSSGVSVVLSSAESVSRSSVHKSFVKMVILWAHIAPVQCNFNTSPLHLIDLVIVLPKDLQSFFSCFSRQGPHRPMPREIASLAWSFASLAIRRTGPGCRPQVNRMLLALPRLLQHEAFAYIDILNFALWFI